MEQTVGNANFSMPEATEVPLLEPESVSNSYKKIKITGMELGFYNAAVEGNIDAFKDKGEQIASILTPNKNTILHIHLTNYSDKVSEKFVEAILHMCPALVMKANAKDETILHIAARYGHSEMVEKIIRHAKDGNEVGAEKRLIGAVNDKKDTALHEAVRYHHIQVVELLIKDDPDHPYLGNKDGETPLYIAVERQYWDVVDKLLGNSNSPNHTGPNGRTALHAAVLHGDQEIVKKLLTRIASAAIEADENGWVPLHLAALRDDPGLAEELLKHDRNAAYMRDNKGRTPLHLAARCGDSATMRKIIECCPDCSELVDDKGYNALHYTTLAKDRFLMKRSAEEILEKAPLSNLYNEKDDNGNTPLHLLARHAPTWQSYTDHPLLEENPRVDVMAFNENNQTVLDVAYDNVPSRAAYENYFLARLQRIRARFGGRVINKYVRKEGQEKRHDSAVDEKEKQEKGHDSADDEKEKRDSGVSEINDPVESSKARVRETASVVATLIATVTFAAAFTMPGGNIQDGHEHQGTPVLKHNAAFKAFVIADSLSFVLSASAVLLQILTSLEEKRKEAIDLYITLVVASMLLTMVAMVLMIVAFGTGVYAVLGVSHGLGIVILLIALSFLFTFAFTIHVIVEGPPPESTSTSTGFFYPEVSFLNGKEIQLCDSI